MGIKIVKKKVDYTFIADNIELELRSETEEVKTNTDKDELDYRLRWDSANSSRNLKHKSKLSGGHNMQGHSAVYE